MCDHNEAICQDSQKIGSMGTGLKSLESCRSVEEIMATCPFTASYVVPVLVPKEEEKGGNYSAWNQDIKPLAYETWDYRNTQCRHAFMYIGFLRLDLDLGVFQNLLSHSEEYSNRRRDWLQLLKFKRQVSIPLQI